MSSFQLPAHAHAIWLTPGILALNPKLGSAASLASSLASGEGYALKARLSAEAGRLAEHLDAMFRVEPGSTAEAAEALVPLEIDPAPAYLDALITRYPYLENHVFFRFKTQLAQAEIKELLRFCSLTLVKTSSPSEGETVASEVITAVQYDDLLDGLYPGANQLEYLPENLLDETSGKYRVRIWAPTAWDVKLVRVAAGMDATKPSTREVFSLKRLEQGDWVSLPLLEIGDAYRFELTHLGDGLLDFGRPRNPLSDPEPGKPVTVEVVNPYAVGLSADSKFSEVIDLSSAETKPDGWDAHLENRVWAQKVKNKSANTIYELHVRDFSRDDESVPEPYRGTYLAFSLPNTNGVRHLQELAAAGMKTIHLLPTYDIASITSPDLGFAQPDRHQLSLAAPDSDVPQALISQIKDHDAFNWGYDPRHWRVPASAYCLPGETSATARVKQFRSMVKSLHELGFNVVLDEVYNHTFAAGNHPDSVLDKVVPGYYHRKELDGSRCHSTCMNNTASERSMVAHLIKQCTHTWLTAYQVDGFRFDLMGHMPAALLKELAALGEARGQNIFYGEGWNFGEVADGARFPQASQNTLAGSGIATFSDRLRDGIRGGSPADEDFAAPGLATGLVFEPSRLNGEEKAAAEAAVAWVKAGLGGNLKDLKIPFQGELIPASAIDYRGSACGYALRPDDIVNYVDAHDNETLWDKINLTLPPETPMLQRIRCNHLALAAATWSQGISFWHAGTEVLRSKSFDKNSYDSGDWFNRYDVTGTDNGFGRGLPAAADNESRWSELAPLLRNTALKPAPSEVQYAKRLSLDLLRVKQATPELSLNDAEAILQRVTFPDTGSLGLVTMRIDPGVWVVLNFTRQQQLLQHDSGLMLHPVLATGSDERLHSKLVAGDTTKCPPLSAFVLIQAQ